MSKKIENLASGAHFTAINIGAMNDLPQYTEMHGKVFTKEALGASGAEVSLQLLPAGAGVPFFHAHKENEEIYIILRGRGEMQIDGQIIPLQEGTMVRVAPSALRCLRAVQDSELLYMVIQAAQGSLKQWTGTDGVICPPDTTWIK